MKPRISIVIPTYNASALLKQTLKSLDQHEGVSKLEVIVVDDGSSTDERNATKRICAVLGVKLLLKPTNDGYSVTANVGAKAASGEFTIFVNNDTVFISKFSDKLIETFDRDPKIAVVGAKLLYPDGRVQHAGMGFDPQSSRFIHAHKFAHKNDPNVNRSSYQIAVTGAFFAVRSKHLHDLRFFDERYQFACEDTDFCLRTWESGNRVFYNHEIELFHLEGGSRGRTEEEKAIKNPKCLEMESLSIERFNSNLYRFGIKTITETVNDLNFGLFKRLEVGCGYNPQPGYLHLDVRQLPGVDVVCDFSKDSLPFKDEEFHEILSNHSIEHVSYRKLPHVLSEWNRVLKTGGNVLIRTPDLEFICRTYLAGRTTKEWPTDEEYIEKNLCEKMTPSWWANLKLFAGQDYDSNFHYFCLDFDSAKELLEKYGFGDVKRVNMKPVFSPGELQIMAAKVTHIKKPVRNILIKRAGALGDVIQTTPLAEELYKDGNKVYIATNSPEVYKNNPYFSDFVPVVDQYEGFDQVIDLDLAYENNPSMHIIDAYEKVSGVKTSKRIKLFPSDLDSSVVDGILSSMQVEKFAVIHPARTWNNRTLKQEVWEDVAKHLKSIGLAPIAVGSGADMKLENAINLHNRFTLQQLADLCSKASIFVGSDSGIYHVAATTDVPLVGVFTCAKAKYREPFRAGVYSVKTGLKCYGCLEKESPPVIFVGCYRGDFACVEKMTSKKIIQAIKKGLENPIV